MGGPTWQIFFQKWFLTIFRPDMTIFWFRTCLVWVPAEWQKLVVYGNTGYPGHFHDLSCVPNDQNGGSQWAIFFSWPIFDQFWPRYSLFKVLGYFQPKMAQNGVKTGLTGRFGGIDHIWWPENVSIMSKYGIPPSKISILSHFWSVLVEKWPKSGQIGPKWAILGA